MKKILFSLVIALTILLVNKYNVYAQFKLSGEFRPRTEINHGYKTLVNKNQDYSVFTNQRTRLNFYLKNDFIKTNLVLQDIRVWGGEPQLVVNELASTSVHEAWAEVFFTPELSLKAGRQELVYDDHRIFGNVGWAPQARSHDLALLKYESTIKLHLGFAMNQNTNITNNFYDGPNAYSRMQYFWVNKETESYNVSILFLNNGRQKDSLNNVGNKVEEGVSYSQTFGGRFVYKTGKLNLGLNAYYQMGNQPGQLYYDVDKKISAYNLRINADYLATEKFKIGAGYETLSGNDQVNPDNINHAFIPFYGTNHKFNGWMDYFYVGNGHGDVGLNDIFLNLKYQVKKIGFSIQPHYFLANAAINNPNSIGSEMNKALGFELDLKLSYNVSEYANISAGYSQMFGAESLEAIKGGSASETNNWAWIMLSVKPKFFSSHE